MNSSSELLPLEFLTSSEFQYHFELLSHNRIRSLSYEHCWDHSSGTTSYLYSDGAQRSLMASWSRNIDKIEEKLREIGRLDVEDLAWEELEIVEYLMGLYHRNGGWINVYDSDNKDSLDLDSLLSPRKAMKDVHEQALSFEYVLKQTGAWMCIETNKKKMMSKQSAKEGLESQQIKYWVQYVIRHCHFLMRRYLIIDRLISKIIAKYKHYVPSPSVATSKTNTTNIARIRRQLMSVPQMQQKNWNAQNTLLQTTSYRDYTLTAAKMKEILGMFRMMWDCATEHHHRYSRPAIVTQKESELDKLQQEWHTLCRKEEAEKIQRQRAQAANKANWFFNKVLSNLFSSFLPNKSSQSQQPNVDDAKTNNGDQSSSDANLFLFMLRSHMRCRSEIMADARAMLRLRKDLWLDSANDYNNDGYDNDNDNDNDVGTER
ncbi:hypothetical protein RFI_23208, partial [Reticulomyxa filosa]